MGNEKYGQMSTSELYRADRTETMYLVCYFITKLMTMRSVCREGKLCRLLSQRQLARQP